MEDTDRQLVTLLCADGRMSFTDLAKETGLSVSAVHQRVRRLQERGVLTGFTAHVDPDAVGLPLTAFVSVNPLDPSAPDGTIPQSGCCLYHPDVGVDSASGQAWVGFTSNEKATPGFFVNAIGPGGAEGGRKLAPGALTGNDFVQPIGRTPITGRIGAAGVVLAYGQGYPTIKKIAVWRTDTAKPQLLLNAPGAKHVALAAAPEGRLWVAWDLGGKIYAARTNHVATRVGTPTAIGAPGSKSVYELDGEGSAV